MYRWAEIVARFLKPGGTFYIAEFHPFICVFDWDAPDDFKLEFDYFHDPEPKEFSVDGSYAESDVKIEPIVEYEWWHGIGHVITSIAKAGLRIHFLHEFPKASFQRFPFLKQREDGYWYYDNPKIQLPLTYSLMATKDG